MCILISGAALSQINSGSSLDVPNIILASSLPSWLYKAVEIVLFVIAFVIAPLLLDEFGDGVWKIN